MNTPDYTQRQRVGGAGSFFNQLMGNNNTAPVVGEWYTQLFYTDRTVGKVVSTEGKYVILEPYEPDAWHNGTPTSFKPSGRRMGVRWNPRKGLWEQRSTGIVFDNKFRSAAEDAGYVSVANYLHREHPELYLVIYPDGAVWPSALVKGVTREKVTHHPVRLIFGVCRYYYDESF